MRVCKSTLALLGREHFLPCSSCLCKPQEFFPQKIDVPLKNAPLPPQKNIACFLLRKVGQRREISTSLPFSAMYHVYLCTVKSSSLFLLFSLLGSKQTFLPPPPPRNGPPLWPFPFPFKGERNADQTMSEGRTDGKTPGNQRTHDPTQTSC